MNPTLTTDNVAKALGLKDGSYMQIIELDKALDAFNGLPLGAIPTHLRRAAEASMDLTILVGP